MKKIDVHVHLIGAICGFGAEGELRALGDGMVEYASGKQFRLIPKGYGDKEVTAETLLSVMDEHEVAYAVCLQGNYVGFQNLYTYEAAQKYPHRLIAAGTFDPFCRGKEKIIHHLFEELKIPVLKMELSNTSGLMANHPTVFLNQAEMDAVYQLADSKNLIVFIDIGRPRNDCYQIAELKESILKYPNVIFILCHLTAPQQDDQVLLEENMRQLALPNVYFDLAALPNNTKEAYPFVKAQQYIRTAMNLVSSDRILWGSDFPSAMNYCSYRESYQYILDSDLFTLEEKEKLFFKNAERLFGRFIQ